MKKGKVFGKSHIAVTVMVVALAAAVGLNMKYSVDNPKYLGEASYVSGSSSKSSTAQVSAKADKESSTQDYFSTAKKERDAARKLAQETIEETLKSEKLTDKDKESALKKVEEMAANIEQESNIESLLKAKGFEKTLAVISDTGCNIIVKSDGLTSAQTLQIQDIVTSQSKVSLSKIKIVPIK